MTTVAPGVDTTGRPPSSGHPWWTPVLVAAFAASGALLATAEWMAARGDGSGHFYVFWVAYFLVVAPVAMLLCGPTTSSRLRGSLVVALGVWSLCPSLLRTGNHPLYFDEFSHLRMLEDLVRTGHPVSTAGLLQIGASFPGLELAASALYHLSGLTLWLSAISIAALAHVALLAGVFVLVRDVARSARAGAIAAVLYSLNPSWLFFDAQFSYETLALPVLVWGLVFALRASARRAPTAPTRTKVLELCIAATLVAALVVIHHVSSVVECAALVGVALAATLQARRGASGAHGISLPVAWGLAGWGVAVTAWRFADVGHPLFVYLGPSLHLSSQLSQLLSVLGIGAGLPLHSAFASSSVPTFEVVCAYAMLPVLLLGFVWALWGLSGHRRVLSPLSYVAAPLGALFFVSLPLASAAAFSEAVHRSWAFSFLGLAIVLGVACGYDDDGALSMSLRGRRLWPPPQQLRTRLAPAVAAALCIVAIGGVAVGTSTSYRFGAAVAPETDPLYVGTQSSMVASWFAAHTTSRDVVYANRFAVRPIAVASEVGVADPAGPQLGLLLAPSIPRTALEAFATDRVTYLVVDRRTGQVGGIAAWFWYVPTDSNLPADERSGIHLDRIRCLDWASSVFATSDVVVLRVARPKLLADLHAGSDGLRPDCVGATGQ